MVENILFVISIICLLLGLFVLFANRKSVSNISFFILCIVGGVFWSISIAMFREATSIEEGLFWDRIIYLCGILAPLAILFFGYCFPDTKVKISQLYKFALIFPIVILTPFLFQTNWWIKEIIISPLGNTVVLGNFYKVWLVYICFYFCWSLVLLFSKYKKSKNDVEKHQFQYIFLGIAFPLIGCLPFNVIFPLFGNYNLIWIGPVTIVFCIVLIAFAILKYHLFNIKVILTEMLVGAMGILLLIQVFLAPTLIWRISSIAIFIFFCFLGRQLINYSHEEEKKREEAEKLAIRERALRERAEKIANEYKRLDETKTMFLNLASHQLRTPLSSMKGYLELALSGNYGKVEGKAREFIESVKRSNEKEINLVNDLLDLNKLQTGKLQFSFQDNVQLEDIIEEVVNEFQPEAQKYNLYLKFNKPQQPLPKITADPQKLRQVILNLVDNALKYTEKGGVTISVQHNNNSRTILTIVQDTGMGMTPQEKEKLFQLFERSKDATSAYPSGVGIGLYFASEIIKAHNGKIWAESQGKGKGSTFYVELPVK